MAIGDRHPGERGRHVATPDEIATADELEEAIHECLDGKLCVQAWLGYGSAIFIGFGDQVIPGPAPNDKHPRPLYELQTLFAKWQVEGPAGVMATWEDESDEVITAAIEALVGRRVISWQREHEQQALTIKFEAGLSLCLAPYLYEEDPESGAWWFVLAEDDKVIGVNSDKSVFQGPYST